MRRTMILGLVALMMALTNVAYAAPGESELAQVREATAKFHQFERGFAAGYTALPLPCVEGMGWHYLSPELTFDGGQVDALQPEVLMYEEGKNGKLTLVGVEYVVPMSDASSPPSLFGRTFDTNLELGLYVLHVWLWRANPDGMFTGSNPRVGCDFAA